MQTFLPYADFRASAAVLDDRRLGKQRVETLQILRALTWTTYGWRNHPAVRMWRGFPRALVTYGLAVCDEWESRGRADAVRRSLLEFGAQAADVSPGVSRTDPDGTRGQRWLRDAGELPPWIGRDAVHLSHRASLVRKEPEHYRRWFPDLPDDLPYVWPAPSFPRWPVRRERIEPLDLPAALLLLGHETPRPGQRQAVDAVRAGASYDLRLPAGAGLTTAGLLAGLCTSGGTVWVTPGPPVELTHAPPAPPSPDAPPGRLSPSIARQPSTADREAMAREAQAEPEFRFFRPAQLAPERLAGAGLVVVETGTDALPDLAVPDPGVAYRGVPVLTLGTCERQRPG